jgi:hypothetical protein
MSDSEKEDLAAWLEERAERLRQKENIEDKEYEELKALHGDKLYMVEEKMAMDSYNKSQLACRAECGEKKPNFTCSKCRIARYCSAACQKEDWKVSLTYLLSSLVPNLI